jgi:indolepyruvate ferredoxin oxidoreductase
MLNSPKSPEEPGASLDDKYIQESGRAYLNGTQALVRLAIMQARRDRAAGHYTAGFVTGYRGSPLGGVDMAFQNAAQFAQSAQIRFLPAVNEDLAATAVLGTQQINLFEQATRQGVFAMWYGKGPGVDRSGDAFRHGNLAGSAPLGGVLLLAGDDHVCKSSTTSHQSEYALMDAMVPILTPANTSDILKLGLYGWALSRYCGCWAALKLVSDVVDSSASIELSDYALRITTPVDFELPPEGLGIRWPDTPQMQERRLHNLKIPAALAFARANGLDRRILGSRRGRLGIVATGKAYLDTRQALSDMGLTHERATALGISLYKVAMVWPLEPEGMLRFAAGFDELLIVEEKRPLIEGQIKDMLYNMPSAQRPAVYGKVGYNGEPALPAHDDLNSSLISRAIWARLRGWQDAAGVRELASNTAAQQRLMVPEPIQRTPYFCSGCPHSTSTRVPEGSRAMAGIGCHWMSQAMDRNTATYTHMGGEGANWIGQAPYVATKHIFQNMGDGTFFHSGLLAIRAAVAAKVVMTYKILFNDAVAMTGGQAHDGMLTPQRITHMVRAEGVDRIAVVTDQPDKYRGQEAFASGATVHHRDDLDTVQRELREHSGVSVLVYDQVCAAAKRRRKKRLAAPKPETRVLINEAVCEGCGDCSKKSNCLSVTPVDTELGRKRQIDQSSCNTDLACLRGFCPSFFTVSGARLRRAQPETLAGFDPRTLPVPALVTMAQPYNVLITGVGGTGVVTIGAILAMAAHVSGKGCSTLDMTGMAQKGGPVTTHLRFAPRPDDLHSTRIAAWSADLILGCDMVTTVGQEALSVIAAGRTRIVLNTFETIVAKFINDSDFRIPQTLVQRLQDEAGPDFVETVDASSIATRLLRDSLGTNLFMVGYACQRGLLPVSVEAILRAIALNGAAVSMNRTSFALGRLAAHDPQALLALVRTDPARVTGSRDLSRSLDEVIARREALLASYQDTRYAARYRGFIDRVRDAEKAATGTEGRLTDAVARSLFKLMAYKDEYEIARLYTDGSFRAQLRDVFESTGRMRLHLAPPGLARIDPVTGEPRKIAFGPWILPVLRGLAALRFLRGTPFDPFGYTRDRRTERQLIDDYRSAIERVLRDLAPSRLDIAVAIANIPQDIRGFGPVKTRHLARATARWTALEEEYSRAAPRSAAHRKEAEVPTA